MALHWHTISVGNVYIPDMPRAVFAAMNSYRNRAACPTYEPPKKLLWFHLKYVPDASGEV